MNVYQNAYYTSEYLQNLHYRQTKVFNVEPGAHQAHTPRSVANVNGPNTPVAKLQIDPQTHLSAQNKSFSPTTNTRNAAIAAESKQLISLVGSHRKTSHRIEYSDYYRLKLTTKGGPKIRRTQGNDHRNHKLFFRKLISPRDNWSIDASSCQGDDTPPYEPSIPNAHAFSGLYTDQYRAYDKPQDTEPHTRNSTKPTFKLDAKHESLNPMDVVFDDLSKRGLKTKQKFARALKLIVPKFRGNDYADYDYSHQVGRDEQESLDARSEYEGGEWNDTTAEWCNQPVSFFGHISPFSFGNGERNKHGLFLNTGNNPCGARGVSMNPQNKRERQLVDNEFRPTYRSDAVANFHTLWNYVLSWIAYSNMDCSGSSDNSKITELADEFDVTVAQDMSSEKSRTSLLGNGCDRPKKGKGYKKVILNWNTPASRLFSDNDQTVNPGRSLMPHERDGFDTVVAGSGKNQQLQHFANEFSRQNRLQVSSEHRPDMSPRAIISNVMLIKSIKIMRIIFSPIDLVAEKFPQIQTLVIFIELFTFLWILYELSLLIDALCMAVKAVCAPMIAVGKFMNRIV